MTDRIEPVLSGYEWSHVRRGGDTLRDAHLDAAIEGVRRLGAEHRTALLAFINDQLPDSDPRKITWETVRAVLAGWASYPLGSTSHRELIQIAAALASYLSPDQQPPELAVAYAAYLPPEGA